MSEIIQSEWPGSLNDNAVHLWVIDTTTVTVPDGLDKLLSPAEQARAGKLAPVYRANYRLQRILLRMLIGRYLNVNAATIPFGTISNGKPCLTGSLQDSLYFNASDTSGVLAAGFTNSGPIGIDMELPDRAIKTKLLARRICSGNEQPVIASVSSREQRQTVLRLWVRKEAVLKGLGHGLRTPMRLLTVTGNSPVPVIFDPAVPDVNPGDHWYVSDIDTDAPFMISLASPFIMDSLSIVYISSQNLFNNLIKQDA